MKTVPLGSYGANNFGAHDIVGNVWEWVEDCRYYNYKDAPSDGSASMSGGNCEERVLRGGSWFIKPWFLRSADCGWDNATVRHSDFGFRIARTLSQ
ncbi:MAG: formylglycine-generating enzyme family protein [Alphaproteobacteria bacterium]